MEIYKYFQKIPKLRVLGYEIHHLGMLIILLIIGVIIKIYLLYEEGIFSIENFIKLSFFSKI